MTDNLDEISRDDLDDEPIASELATGKVVLVDDEVARVTSLETDSVDTLDALVTFDGNRVMMVDGAAVFDPMDDDDVLYDIETDVDADERLADVL